mmetsp:Transcript_6689/g.25819  ORF Transcript_6689/g.25819 Transcript_6689/m.25819 type:complete len:200 (+) Transcript_6689:2957-3556(+)
MLIQAAIRAWHVRIVEPRCVPNACQVKRFGPSESMWLRQALMRRLQLHQQDRSSPAFARYTPGDAALSLPFESPSALGRSRLPASQLRPHLRSFGGGLRTSPGVAMPPLRLRCIPLRRWRASAGRCLAGSRPDRCRCPRRKFLPARRAPSTSPSGCFRNRGLGGHASENHTEGGCLPQHQARRQPASPQQLRWSTCPSS